MSHLVQVAVGRLADGRKYLRRTYYDGGLHHVVLVWDRGRWRQWSVRHLKRAALRPSL